MNQPLRRTLPVLAALALFAAIAASAAPRPGLPGCKNPRAIARYLKLTPDQVAQTKTLRAGLKAAVDPLYHQIEALHEQIQDALEAASPDACAIGALRIQIYDVGEQVRDERDEFEAAFEALLTADQLTKWEALKTVCRAEDETTGG
jgi:Spy/CpxP family protein refolding chaperone